MAAVRGLCGTNLEICVIHMLKDQRWRLGLRVTHHIQQLDDVGATMQVLQDLDFALDLHAAQTGQARELALAQWNQWRTIAFTLHR